MAAHCDASSSPASVSGRRSTSWQSLSGSVVLSAYNKFRGEFLRVQSRAEQLQDKMELLSGPMSKLMTSSEQPFIKIRLSSWPTRKLILHSLMSNSSSAVTWARLSVDSKTLVKEIITNTFGYIQYVNDNEPPQPLPEPQPEPQPLLWGGLRFINEMTLELFDCTGKPSFIVKSTMLSEHLRLMNSILDTIARLIDAVSMLSDCGAEVASPGAGGSAGSSSSGAGGAAGGAWVANSVDA